MSKLQMETESSRKLKHKFNSLKTDFEANKVESFDQINALIPPSVFAKQLNMGFNTYKNKCNNPGDFTMTELIRIAELVNIEISVLLSFVLSVIKSNTKLKPKSR